MDNLLDSKISFSVQKEVDYFRYLLKCDFPQYSRSLPFLFDSSCHVTFMKNLHFISDTIAIRSSSGLRSNFLLVDVKQNKTKKRCSYLFSGPQPSVLPEPPQRPEPSEHLNVCILSICKKL